MVERTVKLEVFNTGYATNIERVVLKTGVFKKINFPAPTFLIEHPNEGLLVYDTGYSSHFFSLESQSFPFNLYNLVAGFEFDPKDSLIVRLQSKGYSSQDVRNVIISHFHADHISGLKDFPFSQFNCLSSAYNSVKNKVGLDALSNAFFPHFLPLDLEDRLNFVEDKLLVSLSKDFSPFEFGYDIFKDGSIYGIPLPGHAKGHLGLLFKDENLGPVFLISDTCWVSESYKKFILPSQFTRFINRDWRDYIKSLKMVHQLSERNSEILIVPSHCKETIEKLVTK